MAIQQFKIEPKAVVKIIAFSCFLCTLVLEYDILKLLNLLERDFTTYIWDCA